MRILAVDYGLARIGLAMSDETALLAQSLAVIKRTSDAEACREIHAVAARHGVEKIVVGLPKLMSGELGERAKLCQRFADRLARETGLPVVLYDERFTTAQAERMLIEADVRRKKRKQVVDAVAATVLLQNYLDAERT
ncbi:Holliday junction resolvase RuvX [Alicyclobacillus cycloheptanicus]|jgi:putative Holliday junction resolvase|uniref:Putative pre-16S rRNA nuclease n=1 Tax=Alicyclobacillus cycloheptanicus TaxID=1457 RepID=A0ABT9XJM8_9BACL|nr:Holliday junction resolvase RuvX [Alicyclobacillus cycloheptanicus]MDQ0190511.1 putative Holliday junction resolvase [Alicyclobacillus cycloheptanicus]WDM00727.1 Holliday junction resolvase RuvX [Alicyclobacillus cycloheptanicus]